MKIIRDTNFKDCDLYWTDNAVTSQFLSKLSLHQKTNHFPGMYTLSRKNYLARNLIKMQVGHPNQYNFFPRTWVLPSQYNQLRKAMQSQPSMVVIGKPQASSQGKGIFLTKNIQQIVYGQHYVIQKYLKKPFLIDGLKFDLRVYVLLTGCQPLRLFIFKQGLARFATQPYCVPKRQNMKNLFMHLTNYAINKTSDKFEFNSSANQMDKGHKRSLTSIMKTIQQLGHSKQKVWGSIKDCIAKTMISAQPLLAHQYKSSQPKNIANNMCFQILGFDVILDSNLNAQILQVNYTPSFTTDTPLDLQIKKNLIHDSLIMMNLTTKAKNQIISQKKRQMKQRTLTGKNFYQSRQQRLQMTQKIQKIRNGWQNNHMGNFERILPVIIQLPKKNKMNTQLNKQIFFQQNNNNKITNIDNLQQQQKKKLINLQDKYNQLQLFATQCYHMNTGANIKRNSKVVKPPKDQGFNLLTIQQNAPLSRHGNSKHTIQVSSAGNQKNLNKTLKLTNTQNLQKIYKTKIKPLVLYNKKMSTIRKKQDSMSQNNQIKTTCLPRTSMQLYNNQNQNKQQTKFKRSPYTQTKGFLNYKRSINSQKRQRNLTQQKNNEIIEVQQQKQLNNNQNINQNQDMSKGVNKITNRLSNNRRAVSNSRANTGGNLNHTRNTGVYNITFNQRNY